METIIQQAIKAHRKKDLKEAEKLYREIIKTEPKQPDANHNLGLILALKNQIDEALIFFKTATEINPDVEQFWLSYIKFFIQQKKYDDAEIISKKALKFKANFEQVNQLLGLILIDLGKFDEAETIYRKIIELNPDYSEAYNNLGTIFYKNSNFKEAEVNYKKAIELKSDYLVAYNNLYSTLLKLNKPEEAKKNYNKSIKLKSDIDKKIVLAEHQKAKEYCENILKIKLVESPVESAFVYREMSQRGFFLKSNLDKIESLNKQLPILTWSFLDFIKTLDLKDVTLHELGSGSSTIWFSDVFKYVESYETNEDWYKKLKPLLKNNVFLKLSKLVDIYKCSIKFKSRDWLLIDFAGKRTKFINELVKRSDDQIPAQVILDNPEWYRNGAKLLNNRGYSEIPFFGFKSSYPSLISCTSLFILKNQFKIKTLSEFYYPMFSRKIKNDWDIID